MNSRSIVAPITANASTVSNAASMPTEVSKPRARLSTRRGRGAGNRRCRVGSPEDGDCNVPVAFLGADVNARGSGHLADDDQRRGRLRLTAPFVLLEHAE